MTIVKLYLLLRPFRQEIRTRMKSLLQYHLKLWWHRRQTFSEMCCDYTQQRENIIDNTLEKAMLVPEIRSIINRLNSLVK
jgi:hypothetical protein